MAPKFALLAVDLLLKDIMSTNDEDGNIVKCIRPFGGKMIILGGDFRQVLPVVKGGNRMDTIDASIKRSPLWPLFRQFSLSRNMRALNDSSNFAEWVLKLGNGQLPIDSDGRIEVPKECISSGDIIHDIFGSSIDIDDVDDICDRIILCPKNFDSLKINEQILDIVPGDAKIYTSIDEPICESGDLVTNYSHELLYSMTPSGMPLHELRLKVGAIVTLLRNLNLKRGLCNGTRLIVKAMRKHSIECEQIVGVRKGERVIIPRIDLIEADSNMPFTLRRRQFPIRLAYAMTINKSQVSIWYFF